LQVHKGDQRGKKGKYIKAGAKNTLTLEYQLEEIPYRDRGVWWKKRVMRGRGARRVVGVLN